ncbi:MAG TPA: hypothetical protein PKC19_16970 [Roseiflexaceae bacterium]|nr:hypothetical protein [Roseiflexaceae bacterium]
MNVQGFDVRIVPLSWGITALLLLAAAVLLWPQAPWGRLRQFWQRAPRLIGGLSALACLLAGWWLIQALQLVELDAALVGLLALLSALIIGVYLPGLPARAHARRRDRLLLQTVDLTGYLQFVVESSQGDVEILRRYVRRPQRPIADVQAVIATALAELDRRRRGNIFEALVDQATETGSLPLIASCTTLMHGARTNRRALAPLLAQQREQLFDTVVEACKQRAQRIELLLIGISAASLAFGLLPFILYVMAGGGTLLTSILGG